MSEIKRKPGRPPGIKCTENDKRIKRGGQLLKLLDDHISGVTTLSSLQLTSIKERLRYTLPTFRQVEHTGLVAVQVTKVIEELI